MKMLFTTAAIVAQKRCGSLAIMALLALACPMHATVLTFDIAGIVNGSNMPQGYGDNVTAATMGSFSYGTALGFTPNVTVQYLGDNSLGTTPELTSWNTGYSDLTNVVEYEPDGDTGYRIILTAAAGFTVSLTSFDLGNFGTGVTLPSLQVLDAANTALLNLTNVAIPANSSPHLSFSGPWTSTVLTIRVNTAGLGGNSDNIGLDNIIFSEAAASDVPEPASVLCVAAGLVALALRRRA